MFSATTGHAPITAAFPEIILDMQPEESFKEEFRNRLKAIIFDSGKSNTQIALEIGVNKNTLTRWLNGDTVPSVLHVENLAKALGVEPKSLFKKMYEHELTKRESEVLSALTLEGALSFDTIHAMAEMLRMSIGKPTRLELLLNRVGLLVDELSRLKAHD